MVLKDGKNGVIMKYIKIIGVVVVILAVIGTGIGVKYKMDQQKMQDDMVKVVKSEEAKEVFKEWIMNIDSKAFTKEGVIQSYKVDYDDIRHNPMGGIMTKLYVNGDSDLYINVTLEKDTTTNKIDSGGGGYSEKLDNLLQSESDTSD